MEGDLKAIKSGLQQMKLEAARDEVPRQGDEAFHAAIAQAANNPFLLDTLSYLNQFLENATRVTRANEATRAELEDEVRDEHHAIVQAIENGDIKAARQAGTKHMLNAARRIRHADPVFWTSQGRALANRLRTELTGKQVSGGPQKPKI